MGYSCKIIADSVNPAGVRLTTFELEYPRFIHAEFMTHRVFSRNAQSNRAIPTAKLIDRCVTDPVTPVEWGVNKAGMQAEELLSQAKEADAVECWEAAAGAALKYAHRLSTLGVHKQIVNRLLEPFQWIRVICSSTTYENFFKLRTHKDAQPEIQRLATMMRTEYDSATPTKLQWGEWHLPYINELDHVEHTLDALKQLAVARCARVSYLNHDKQYDPDKDYQLHDRLAESGHWSPFEHVAQAYNWTDRYSNFHPTWLQYRKTFAGEAGLWVPISEGAGR